MLTESQEQREERRQHAQWEAEQALPKVTVELTIDGRSMTRTFRLADTAHMNWNPILNHMAEVIAKNTTP